MTHDHNRRLLQAEHERPSEMYSFKIDVAELGEVIVTYDVTDPGMKPRYGGDPDPGHEPEIDMVSVTFHGHDIGVCGLYLMVNSRLTPVEEYLWNEAHEHHARHGG